MTIHFALGDLDLGFAWLDKACDDRCFELLALKVDPRFDGLRDDEQFAALTRRVGLASSSVQGVSRAAADM